MTVPKKLLYHIEVLDNAFYILVQKFLFSYLLPKNVKIKIF
jgi:hypothetical protein